MGSGNLAAPDKTVLVWVSAYREMGTDRVLLYAADSQEEAERGYADAVKNGLGVDFPHTIHPMLVPEPRKKEGE